MRTLIKITTITILLLISNLNTKAQCNTDISICSSTSGPFTFAAPGAPVSSCLDFYGPGYAYIGLYITSSGALEMLIDGDASWGYLDVAIFKVPNGVSPCEAIQDLSNQISCNYASSASGCNQIGSYFSCPSKVSAPYVHAGDRLMIVVENWSGASSNFTLSLGSLPAAQSGPANPTIQPINTVLTEDSAPYQMIAVDNGGTWSGNGVTSGGLFDPSIAGIGTHTITYEIGTGPCATTDSYDIVVSTALPVLMKKVETTCSNGTAILEWETLTELNCDYFRVDKSKDAQYYEPVGIVKGNGTTSLEKHYLFKDDYKNDYSYYRIVQVDYNGLTYNYGPYHLKCKEIDIAIYPNPAKYELNLSLKGFDPSKTNIQIIDQMGRIVLTLSKEHEGKINLPIYNFASGIYTILIKDDLNIKTTLFSKI